MNKRVDKKYASWIEDQVAFDPYGQCEEVTISMAAAFPQASVLIVGNIHMKVGRFAVMHAIMPE